MSNEKSSWVELYNGTTRARGLGARLAAEAKRATVEQPQDAPQTTTEALGSTALSGSAEGCTEPTDEVRQARTHVGFATEPGYSQASNAWGGRKVDDNPRYF